MRRPPMSEPGAHPRPQECLTSIVKEGQFTLQHVDHLISHAVSMAQARSCPRIERGMIHADAGEPEDVT